MTRIRALWRLLPLVVLAAVPSPARAATVEVNVAGLQFVGGGYVAEPTNTYPTYEKLPDGNALSVPRLRRGDRLTFINRDAVAHHPQSLQGPYRWGNVGHLDALKSATLTITSSFPAGTYVYHCDIHKGMRGSFIVG